MDPRLNSSSISPPSETSFTSPLKLVSLYNFQQKQDPKASTFVTICFPKMGNPFFKFLYSSLSGLFLEGKLITPLSSKSSELTCFICKALTTSGLLHSDLSLDATTVLVPKFGTASGFVLMGQLTVIY